MRRRAALLVTALAVSTVAVQVVRAADDPVPAVAGAWIDDPLDGSVVPLGPVEVVGHATDPAGLTRIDLLVDGEVVGPATGGAGLVTATWTWTPTTPGEHVLVVRAVGRSATDSAEVIVVAGAEPGSAATDAATSTTAGETATTTVETSTATSGPVTPTSAGTVPRTTSPPATTTPRTTVAPPTTPATTPATTTLAPTTTACTNGAPAPAAPVGGGDVADRSPTLTWRAPAGCAPTGYAVETSLDPGFARLDQSASVNVTQWTVSGALTNCAVYYWRVRALFGRTLGPWSTTASFRINVGSCP